MALKAVLDTLDGLSAEVAALYTEKDGKFGLAVEGMVTSDKLAEFRNNNTTLRQQMEALQAKFDGVDPDKFRELAEKEAKQRDKRLIDAGKVDELLAERTGAMRADYETRMAALDTEKKAATKQLEGLLIDSALREAALKAGVLPTAVDDVLLRGRQTFRLHEGKATAFEGDKMAFGKDSEPLSIAEWTAGLADKAAHLFAASSGGGSSAAQPGGGNFGVIARSNTADFLSNLDAIAKNKKRVV